MTDLAFNVGLDLSRYYQRVAEQIHKLVEPLSTEQIWKRPYSYGNSPGHLLLHLTGNLSYYIGTEIAGTGYVRNRDLEFTDTTRAPKETVLKAFDDAIKMVQATLAQQSTSDWMAPYTAKGAEDAGDRFTIFLRCAAHLQHHAAQIIYLCREIDRQSAQAKGA